MLKIRKAQIEDSHTLFEIRNDPRILKHSFNSQQVLWQDHEIWFRNCLSDTDRLLLVVTHNDKVAGSVRYDCKPSGQAEVSIYIDPSFWGKGLASFALAEGEKHLRLEKPSIRSIVAKVFSDNTSSQKLFEKADFQAKYITFEKEVK